MSEMTILVKEPHKAWQKREIDGSLESMQELVGGYIEVEDEYMKVRRRMDERVE